MSMKQSNSKLEILREIKTHEKIPNICTLGAISESTYFCKYLDVYGFYKCIENQSILFKEPCGWNDSYESKLYCADYSKVGLKDKDIKRIYACCVTDKLSSEASWKAYLSFDENKDDKKKEKDTRLKQYAVMMKFNSNEFRMELSKAIINQNLKLYEGRVKYVDVKLINDLGIRNSKINNIMFKATNTDKVYGSFLSSLLLKRLTFNYEKETRFFIEDKNEERSMSHNDAKSKILNGISWDTLIKEVVVCPTCPNELFKEIKKKCKNAGISNVRKSRLYLQSNQRFQISGSNKI